LKQKLGDPEYLPSVTETKQVIGQTMSETLTKHVREMKETAKKSYEPYKHFVQTMKARHQEQRKELRDQQKERWQDEEQERLSRLPRGIKSLWYRLIGTYQKIQMQNAQEFDDCRSRDWHERQNMIQLQLEERGKLQNEIAEFRESYTQTMLDLRRDIGRYQEMGEQALEKKEPALSISDKPARKRSRPKFEYKIQL
jgi:hypothetical protein